MRSSKLRDVQQTKNFSFVFFFFALSMLMKSFRHSIYVCSHASDKNCCRSCEETDKEKRANGKKTGRQISRPTSDCCSTVDHFFFPNDVQFVSFTHSFFGSKRMCRRICNFSQWPYYDDWPKKLAHQRRKKKKNLCMNLLCKYFVFAVESMQHLFNCVLYIVWPFSVNTSALYFTKLSVTVP